MSDLEKLAGLAAAPMTEPPTPAPPIIDGDYEIDVVPYHGDLDPNAAYFLHYFWKRLLDDGLMELYFPGMGDKSYCTFVKLFSSATNIVIVVRKDIATKEIVDTIGFASWDQLRLGVATVGHAGFIFLKEFWNRHTTLAAARRIERYWFDNMPETLDTVMGIIALDNRLAQRFMHNLGWVQAGVLPGMHEYAGKQSDATIWYLTRADFTRLEAEGKA
jgi:RimJ/RimL family protein N-acetyltransferase